MRPEDKHKLVGQLCCFRPGFYRGRLFNADGNSFLPAENGIVFLVVSDEHSFNRRLDVTGVYFASVLWNGKICMAYTPDIVPAGLEQ